MNMPFVKQPSERYTRWFDFANKLPAGRSLASATLSARRGMPGECLQYAEADNSVLASLTGTVSGTDVLYEPQAGIAGYDYLITCRATMDSGQPIEEDVVMMVRDL